MSFTVKGIDFDLCGVYNLFVVLETKNNNGGT